MKRIVIEKKTQIKEILIFLVTFIFSFLLNIIAIIIYDASWWEIISEIHYVFIISLIIYFTILAIRAILKAIKIFIQKIIIKEK